MCIRTSLLVNRQYMLVNSISLLHHSYLYLTYQTCYTCMLIIHPYNPQFWPSSNEQGKQALPYYNRHCKNNRVDNDGNYNCLCCVKITRIIVGYMYPTALFSGVRDIGCTSGVMVVCICEFHLRELRFHDISHDENHVCKHTYPAAQLIFQTPENSAVGYMYPTMILMIFTIHSCSYRRYPYYCPLL